jgi:hypothetical protein
MVRRPREPDLIRPLSPAEQLCLGCPLPECDEADRRCPYQRATGHRARSLAWLRAHMRRRRAAPLPGQEVRP